MDQTVKIGLQVDAKGNASKEMRGLSTATRQVDKEAARLTQSMTAALRDMAAAEQGYQSLLKDRVKYLEAAAKAAKAARDADRETGGKGKGKDGGSDNESDSQRRKQASFFGSVLAEAIGNKLGVRVGGKDADRGGLSSLGAAFNNLSSLGKVGAAIGLAAVASKGFEYSMRGVAGAFNIANDGASSAAVKWRQFGEAIPIFGGAMRAWRELTEAISKSPEDLRKAMVELEDGVRTFSNNLQTRVRTMGVDAHETDLATRAGAFRVGQLRTNSPLVPGAPERNLTAANERATASYERTLPVYQQQLQLRRDIRARQSQGNVLRFQSVEFRNQQETAAEELTAHKAELKKVEGGSDQNAREAAAVRVQAAAIKVQQTAAALEASVTRELQNQEAIIQKQNELRRADVSLTREKLQLAKQEEERTKSFLEAYGELTAPEQISFGNAAQRAKEQGYGALSEDERNLLRKGGGGEFAREQARLGAADNLGAQNAARLLGINPDAQAAQKQVVQFQGEANVQVELNEEALAKALRDELGDLLKSVRSRIQEQNQAANDQTVAERQRREAQRLR